MAGDQSGLYANKPQNHLADPGDYYRPDSVGCETAILRIVSKVRNYNPLRELPQRLICWQIQLATSQPPRSISPGTPLGLPLAPANANLISVDKFWHAAWFVTAGICWYILAPYA
jgi:hypothetical protein